MHKNLYKYLKNVEVSKKEVPSIRLIYYGFHYLSGGSVLNMLFSSVIGAYQIIYTIRFNFYSRLYLFLSNRIIESRRECMTNENKKNCLKKIHFTQRNFNET